MKPRLKFPLKQQARQEIKRLECCVVAKNQQRLKLAELSDNKCFASRSPATKTEIRKAALKIESEYEITVKLIYNLKEIVALEDGDENVDIDATIEALDKKLPS